MKSRREFLQAGMAVSLLPMVIPASGLAASDREPHPDFYKVIYDERFPASVDFGREMERLGAPVHAIRGDITDLWFYDLDIQWNKRPLPIAGLTAHGALFCLERLAWDHGMRVVFRADQETQGGEQLISWIIAPKART
jgi:hypothetical protein